MTEIEVIVTHISFHPPGEDNREKKYQVHKQFGDRREGVTGARTYFYADEAKCDQHMETFIKCIQASGTETEKNATQSCVHVASCQHFVAVGGSSVDGFSAIKMTALGRPQFLVGSKGRFKGPCTALSDTDTILLKAPVLRGPGEMAAVLHLPSITAGERRRGSLRAEAGAGPAAGGVLLCSPAGDNNTDLQYVPCCVLLWLLMFRNF